MTNPVGSPTATKSPPQRRLRVHLQNAYTRKTHWLHPLPWKSNFKFLFDQAYLKDVRYSQTVHYDSLCKQGETLTACNNFIFVLLNTLDQLELRLATIGGNMGHGKTTMISKFLRDWVRVTCSDNNKSGKIFLRCDLTRNDGSTRQLLDLNNVLTIFDIPDYLADEFVGLIESNGENMVILVDTHDINTSSRLIFKLFYKVFPLSKFIIFHRPDIADAYRELPKSQEYFYLLRRRIELKIHKHEHRQTLALLKQISFNSVMLQNFRDTLHENTDLRRLCTNPFLCMMVANLYKETKSMKFVENKLLFFRKILAAMWKRYSNMNEHQQSESDTIQHIDSVLLTISETATETYTTNCHLNQEVLSNNEHTLLLLDSGLLIEHSTDDVIGESQRAYSFFDPLLHEYACALHYARQITERSEEIAEIGNTLFSAEWKSVCVFVAGLLGKRFGLLLKEIDFQYMDDSALNILSNSLHQCQCPKICLKDTKRMEVPQVIDFSELPISSSTLKGLQVLIDWANESNNNNNVSLYQNHRNSLNNKQQTNYQKFALEKFASRQDLLNDSNVCRQSTTNSNKTSSRYKYSSCPDLNTVLSTISISFDSNNEELQQEPTSWSSHYQTHLNKQKSMANLNSLGVNNTKNKQRSHTLNISPTRYSFGGSFFQQDDGAGLRSRAESSISLYSSTDSLLANGKKNSVIKELRAKGSCFGNRTFASLITFLRTNQIERLFLMDQPDDEGTPNVISSKLTSKFLEAITNLHELSLNTNQLGSNWMERLIDVIVNNTSIKYLSVAVLDLEELNVENALKLAKAFHRNRDLDQFELYCGVQSIVVQTSLGFFVDILERDERISVIFL